MTQTLIEKLEELQRYTVGSTERISESTGAWIKADDLRAIIEEYKATEQAPVCEMCKGSGEIGGQVSYCMNEYGYETVDCPDCGGTGDRNAVAVFGGRRSTPEGTTEFYGHILNNKNNGDLHNGTVLFTHPQPSDETVKDAAIGKLVREKMQSGNDVPVSRCTITRTEFDEAMKAAKP